MMTANKKKRAIQAARVAVIGGGKMGAGLVRGWLAAAALRPEDIVVAEPHVPSAETLAALGVRIAAAGDAVAAAPLVVLAVKPQVLAAVVQELAAALSGRLAVSIAAGIPLKQLEAWAPAARWVRAMPNQPVTVRAGATALVAAAGVRAAERRDVEALFAAVGRTVWLDDEAALHAVTGLAGSGPAFVAVFLEAMEDAGVRAGLPRQLARELALATVAGSVAQLRHTSCEPAQLKDAVTSPGGTTIAGLAALEEAGLRAAVHAAVAAATARSRELAGDA